MSEQPTAPAAEAQHPAPTAPPIAIAPSIAVAPHVAHTAVGDLRQIEALYSPQLDNRRDILVYLPPGHDEQARRYPTIYMHDGQNLFDEATSYVGEWRVDETMEALSGAGYPAIVVGIPNMGEQRIAEYGPFQARGHRDSRGDAYLAFVVETLKPLIDERYRTLAGREHTGILGSSMGGLISLYAFFHHPQIFGFVGAMSPSLWFARRAIFPFVRRAPRVQGRIYLDIGTGESEHMVEDARRMGGLLVRKGYRLDQDLCYVEDQGAPHHESAWGARLLHAIPFLLSGAEPAGAPVT